MAPAAHALILPSFGLVYLFAVVPWLAARFWRAGAGARLRGAAARELFGAQRERDTRTLCLLVAVLIPASYVPAQTIVSPATTLADGLRGVATCLGIVAFPLFYLASAQAECRAGRWRRLLQPGFVYGVAMASSIAFVGATLFHAKGGEGNPEAVMTVIPLFRLAVSVVNRQTWAAALWNGVSSVVLLAILHSRESASPYPGLVATELVQYMIIVLVTRMFELASAAEAMSTASARSERQALHSILNATCDAVVKLDADLRISGHSPKLASILLRSTAAPALHEEPFMSLVAQEASDGSSAAVGMATLLEASQTQSVSSNPAPECEDLEAARVATSHQVFLLDRQGSKVPMKALCTPLVDLDGTLRHLIGLSELVDQDDQWSRSMQLCSSEEEPHESSGSQREQGSASDASWRSFTLDGAASEPAETVASASASLMNGRLSETPRHMRQRFLHQELCSWNIRVFPAACCHFHAHLAAATREVQSMKRVSCHDAPQQLPQVLQCANCSRLRPELSRRGLCAQCEPCAPDDAEGLAGEP